MTAKHAFELKRMLLHLRALAFGVLVAVILVSIYTWLSSDFAAKAAKNAGGELLIPVDVQVAVAAAMTTIYGPMVAIFCVPLWVALSSWIGKRMFVAVVLGFFATMAAWIAMNANGHSNIADLAVTGLPYGICGGLAGIATWWAAPQPIATNMFFA